MTVYEDTERGAGSTLVAIIGGVCAAFGVLLLFAAAAAAVAAWVGVDADMSTNRWRQAGWAVTGGATLTLLAGFFLGGYMAGRAAGTSAPSGTARGAGHGVLVFLLGAAVLAGAAVVTAAFVDIDLRANAESAGIPTFADPWTTIGSVAAVSIGLAMMLGAILGGMLGGQHARPVIVADVERERVVDADRTEAVDLRDDRADGDDDNRERVVTHADGTMTTEPEHDHTHN